MEKEKVMSWVQKLLTKSMHPGTPRHEMLACENKAAELMARYKISATQAMQTDESSDPLHGIEREDINFIVGGRTDWGYFLASAIASSFDCKTMALKYKQSVCFIGYTDDVDTCKWFFNYLQIEIYLWAEKHSTVVKERNSYAHGMVRTIGMRLRELYKKVEEIIPSDCKALVVVKKEKVSKFLRKEFPSSRPMRQNKSNFNSFSQGMKDGKNLDLSNGNRARVGEQSKIA